MGTRNITRVILDGQAKVNQYCQWDGYPTGRAKEVLTFLQSIIRENQVDEMRDRLRAIRLVNTDHDKSVGQTTYTGAPYTSASEKIFDKYEKFFYEKSYRSQSEFVRDMLADGRLSMDEAKYLMAASRDTGNKILDFIYECVSA